MSISLNSKLEKSENILKHILLKKNIIVSSLTAEKRKLENLIEMGKPLIAQ